MSVSEVILSSQGASGGVSGDSPDKISATYSSNYRVSCSSQSDAPSTVLAYFAANGSLPYLGRPFRFGNGFDFTVFCNSINANYVEKSAGVFTVTCSFKSLDNEDQEDQRQGKDVNGKTTSDPTKWHDEIDFSFTQLQEVAEFATFRQAINGKDNPYLKPGVVRAVTNSALMPFDPPLVKEVNIRVIRITKRSKACRAIKYAKYVNAINSDSFDISKPAYGFSYPVGQYNAKLKQFSTTFIIENGVKYWQETVELHIHPNGWRRVVLDQGVHRGQNDGDKDDAGNTISALDTTTPGWVPYTPVKDTNGFPITTPVPLDGAGQPLLAGKPHVYLVYSVENELPFSGIDW